MSRLDRRLDLPSKNYVKVIVRNKHRRPEQANRFHSRFAIYCENWDKKSSILTGFLIFYISDITFMTFHITFSIAKHGIYMRPFVTAVAWSVCVSVGHEREPSKSG